ncbi:hypothetical protein SNE25_29480 [Mucilaginibacter sabulilitoris]|uniref:HNH endonuclease 5 domain-containing protein n=1 Tax=Mucilaginibacter sabulilitoris TaxID=1173583 RepID=A0ABZ0TL69_9SPHI|nr:hypothetical protein [Mucilaginibacter sabulilitoris]WPU93456.1 hypothetical protein SNE25_29480 [Mucilaginibacter sabulilitoris]
MSNAQIGICKLCGTKAKLTYEHVPPKKAYNTNRFYIFPSDSSIDDPFLKNPRGRPEQGGIGYYSLCETCNNNTGGWYGNAYIEFVNQAVYRLRLADAQYVNGDPYIIHPLKVIKQIMSFFVTLGSINYSENFPDLTEFVLNKSSRILPPNYQVFMYYNDSSNYRYMADNFVYDKGIIQNYSEIAHFPFGFLLSFKKTDVPIDNRLVDITSWKNYPFERKNIRLSIPAVKLPVELAMFPGDYRTREEIETTIKESTERFGTR